MDIGGRAMGDTDQRRIAIVTDSTADLAADFVEEHGIRVVPQVLIMGTNTWRDGVDIDSPSFYELLRNSSDFPSTSQPSANEFEEVFVELSAEADGVVAILVSDELSGTLNSAQMAQAKLPDLPIEVIDSRSVSMQLGLIVMAAARVAAEGGDLQAVADMAAARVAAGGGDLQAVADTARGLVGKAHVYFVVDTLEYLHRGGRIGGAARLFGSALNLKPVLAVLDGIVTPITRVRTRRKALDKVLELVEELLSGSGGVHMAALHVAAPEEVTEFSAELEARFHPVEMLHAECGPVVGAHVGPGTVGVAFYVE
jgi:fatty acid-binding protein DegV